MKKKKRKNFGFCYVTKRGAIMKGNGAPILNSDQLEDKDSLLHLFNKFGDDRLHYVLDAYLYACKLRGINEVKILTYYKD